MPELPRRYRLAGRLPLTWRGEGVLQLGLDAAGIVLEGVPAGVADAVTALAEPRTIAELERLAPGLPAPWLPWLLARLDSAGLLATDPGRSPRFGLIGDGVLADQIADGVTRAGPAEVVRFSHARRPRPNDSPLPHWGRLTDELPAFVVIATDTQEPDRILTDALARTGRTHLIVRLEADRAVVGPLVSPGSTPCVRCQDLLRCRYDPAWPILAAQLCRDRPVPDPTLLAWAVSTAVVQIQCQLRGGEPDVTGRTLELHATDLTLHTREWPVHPGCGCTLAVA